MGFPGSETESRKGKTGCRFLRLRTSSLSPALLSQLWQARSDQPQSEWPSLPARPQPCADGWFSPVRDVGASPCV